MTATLAPPLPQNLDAERSVLGAILLDNGQYDVAARHLAGDEFYPHAHQKIWRAIAHLAAANQAVDLVTLAEHLRVRGELEDAGGAAYLAQMLDGVPRVTHLEHYCRIVREKAQLRRLIHAGHAIEQAAFESEDPAAVLESAERAISGIGERSAVSELQPLRDIVDENLAALEAGLLQERGVSGLPTGYTQLDQLLAGLHRGNLVILAARPSVGKTAMALNIAENMARAGTPVAFFSLEMTKREILQRLVSSHAHINLHVMRGGGMNREGCSKVTAALAEIAQWPIYIDDANPTTVAEIGAKTRWLRRKHAVSVVMVDYLQLVSGGRERHANRNEEVGAASHGFKALAKSQDLPVLVLSQLTRASEREERRPQLSDLRESGAIEQDADVVMFIHRPKAFAVGEPAAIRNRGEVIVAKQRNGPTESVQFIFLSPFTRYEEADPSLFADQLQDE